MNKSDLQLTINSEIRKHKLRNLKSMQWALCIPPADYKALMIVLPELHCDDAMTRDKAWRAFIASDLSKPYRVLEQKSNLRMSDGKAAKAM